MIPSEDRILKCDSKDKTGLNDFHSLPDIFGLDIDKVGINRFRIPVKYKTSEGELINHDTEASMYIQFPKGKAGINMSRLYEILQQEVDKSHVCTELFRSILHRYRSDMRDDEKDPLFNKSYLKLRFRYALKQKALKSPNWGWQYYRCILEGKNDEGVLRFFLTVKYEYSSTCPCSLSMSKQYEHEHSMNRVSEGNGMAVPHSQRSEATVTVELENIDNFFVADLVELLRGAIPTETQSFVKRMDEQAFAVLNAQNPMFVEHATRRLSEVLNSHKLILDWVASVEHWESLHSHNAVAVIRKFPQGGLK
ncbi:MAG: GTP cyclohydrolase FolE2 [Candidatus Omnitrophica bacterium]|nr:GTP cyclohydrolase FolE2 [Candidatus Omnitrophota bacterium]